MGATDTRQGLEGDGEDNDDIQVFSQIREYQATSACRHRLTASYSIG